MDFLLVIPTGFSIFSGLKILHRNIFFYGILLNLIPASLSKILKNPFGDFPIYFKIWFTRVFWAYQFVLIIAIIVNISGYFQPYDFFEFSWIFDILIFSFLFFYIFLMYKFGPKSGPSSFIWIYYLVSPFFILLVYFFLINFNKPVGLIQSSSLFSPFFINLLNTGFRYHLYILLIPLLFFGIIYFIESREIKLSPDFLNSLKIQWLLHLSLSSIGLYVYFLFLTQRQSGPIARALSISAYVPFFVGLLNIRFLGKLQPQRKYLGYLGFLIQVYVLGQIIANFKPLDGIFMFTNWFSAQNHLISAGIILPLLIILIFNNTETKDYNKFINLTLYFVLIFAIISWIMGSVESGMWYKETAFRFLEFPGWIKIEKNIFPLRLFRLIFDFVCAAVIFIFLFKSIRKLNIN